MQWVITCDINTALHCIHSHCYWSENRYATWRLPEGSAIDGISGTGAATTLRLASTGPHKFRPTILPGHRCLLVDALQDL